MPDICDLILDDHEILRRRFAELDQDREASPEVVEGLWGPVATLLELHAAVEEQVFYPSLLDTGSRAKQETEDAIKDHNDIRHAVSRAGQATPGSQEWWEAVRQAREQNSDHMAEEERGALADLRAHASAGEREELGANWIRFRDEHSGLRGVAVSDKDPKLYLKDPG
jgi:hypothetical protein